MYSLIILFIDVCNSSLSSDHTSWPYHIKRRLHSCLLSDTGVCNLVFSETAFATYIVELPHFSRPFPDYSNSPVSSFYDRTERGSGHAVACHDSTRSIRRRLIQRRLEWSAAQGWPPLLRNSALYRTHGARQLHILLHPRQRLQIAVRFIMHGVSIDHSFTRPSTHPSIHPSMSPYFLSSIKLLTS